MKASLCSTAHTRFLMKMRAAEPIGYHNSSLKHTSRYPENALNHLSNKDKNTKGLTESLVHIAIT